MIAAFSPSSFYDYELIDVGGNEKLERFGTVILRRPEPQAVWRKILPEAEWQKAHFTFKGNAATGEWLRSSGMQKDRWTIKYILEGSSKKSIQLRLGLTAFKHVGVFPEQSVNWKYIYENILGLSDVVSQVKFLNLFAYTGAASLAARAAGADVTHVDSIKQVVTWANENQQLSGLDGVRWLVEDALKYVKREIKREKIYHGIILDPPAYGNGPNGEKWKLEDLIGEMMQEVVALLDAKHHFLILNTYSLGFSSLVVENLMKTSYTGSGTAETGELFLKASTGLKLPLGVFGRVKNF